MSASNAPTISTIGDAAQSMKEHFTLMDNFFEWKFRYEGDESVWSYIKAKRQAEELSDERLH